MRLIYSAKRNLATGHSVDTQYEIAIPAWVMEPRFLGIGPENRSIDGSFERELYRIDTEYRVQTDRVESGQDVENFEEFLWSVSGGETFTFDPTSDTATVAGDPTTAMMISRRFNRTLISPGNYQYSFDVRTLS